jgi:cytochrome c oxidase subunit IV
MKYYAFMHMVWAKVIVRLVTPILPPSLLCYAFMHMVAYVDDEYGDDIFRLVKYYVELI